MLEQEKHNTSSASLNATLPAMMKTLDYEYTKGTTGRWVESMGCIALCTFASLRYATLRYATLRFASLRFGRLRGTTGDFAFSRAFYTADSGFLRPASPRFAALRFASLPFLRVFYFACAPRRLCCSNSTCFPPLAGASVHVNGHKREFLGTFPANGAFAAAFVDRTPARYTR